MASIPSHEENGRTILSIFAWYELREGEILMLQHINQYLDKHNLRADDLNDGITYGIDNGWFEQIDDTSYRLTKSGFEQMD